MNRITPFLLLCALLCGCLAASPAFAERSRDPKTIQDVTWQWTSTVTPTAKIEVDKPERYTLLLTSAGQAQVRFDCNRGGGAYTISEGKLSFGPMPSTMAACEPGSLDGAYAKDLQRASTFFVEGGTLYIELPQGSGTMAFRRAGQ